tara:strand:- start:438 stop:1928 length:1491 start_codon:yes stop_codon:yes gene_type:complete
LVNKLQKGFQKFLNSEKPYPILSAIAAGLYPILFYYSRNFNLINTWEHLGYFVFCFLAIPTAVFWLSNKLIKLKLLRKWKVYLIPFLNVFTFLFLLKICLYAGIQKKLMVVIFVAAILFALFLHKQIKKLVVLELFLAILVLFVLIPELFKSLYLSEAWTKQQDTISEVIFKKTPNVYLIQPDGYVNYSELKTGFYNYNNDSFEGKMDSFGFENYPDFRSNYATTLSSNSATFAMKHHYYGNGADLSEGFNARKVIISQNPVLDVFRKNEYITHFISEKPYLLLNRPKVGYDESNFDVNEIPYISTGLKGEKNVLDGLSKSLGNNFDAKNHFFFIEFFNPGHISNIEMDSSGKEGERLEWLSSLERANEKLLALVKSIKEKDSNSLIIIMADHGGFVGMDYSRQIYTKTEDRDLIYSIFSSNLSIHWPNNERPEFDSQLKSSVNVFRIIFSYLSEDDSYLLNLQENASFVIIKKDAPVGVYKYIDEAGDIVFEKVE